MSVPDVTAGGFPRQLLGCNVALRLDTLAIEVWNHGTSAWVPLGPNTGPLAYTVLVGAGTHVLNTSTTVLDVYLLGSGAAGGGATSTGAAAGCGGGGGGGARLWKRMVGGLVASYDYVIGPAVAGVAGAAGPAGVASTLAPHLGAVLLTAGGGFGGAVMLAVAGNAWAAGGLGGLAVGGDRNASGAPGTPGGHPSVAAGCSGTGGSGEDGGGGLALVANGAGNPATGLGGGGGGGVSFAGGATPVAGGASLAGTGILVEWRA